jgi:hypothetical protein
MPVKKMFSHLPVSLVNESMRQSAYAHNHFICFLAQLFGWETALQAAERYNIGSSKHWHGATVFWQVDANGLVRTGKIMLYNPNTGKRIKQPFNHIAWVHSLVGKSQLPVGSRSVGDTQLAGGDSGQLPVGCVQTETANSAPNQVANHKLATEKSTANCPPQTANFHLKQCFFGEHLLWGDTTAMVGIAESEKTAVMASIMMPQFIWLAAGSLHGLDEDKCRVLKNRRVMLFPDVGAHSYWTQCARFLNLKIPSATFTVHDEMERTATDEERENGADMGDRWVGEREKVNMF